MVLGHESVLNILNIGFNGVAFVNADGMVTHVNRVWADAFGTTPEALIGMPAKDVLLFGDSPNSFFDRVQKTLSKKVSVCIRAMAHRPNATHFYAEIIATRMYDEQGQEQLLFVMRDSTLLTQADSKRLEARYKLLFEKVNDAIFFIEKDGTIVDVNPRAVEMFGYTKEELSTMSALDLIPPEKHKRLQGEIRQTFINGLVRSYWRIPSKTGEWLDVELLAQPISDNVFVAFVRDKTGELRAQNALQEREAHYRQVVEHTTDGVVVIQGAKIVLGNPAIETILGYSKEEIVGSGFDTFIAPNDLELEKERRRRRMAGENGPQQYEIHLQRKDGALIEVQLNATVVPYRGAPADLVLIRNISEQKRYDRLLQQQTTEAEKEKEVDEAILKSLGDGVFVVTPDLHISLVNRRLAELLGRPTQELIGRRVDEVFHVVSTQGETLLSIDELLNQSIKNRRLKKVRYRLKTPIHSKGFPILLIVSSVSLDNGELLGAVGIVRDLSKEAEIERTKAEFVSVASHQLNEPTTEILWAVEGLLEENGSLTIEQKETLQHIQTSAKQMGRLVHALLNVATIESGKQKISFKPIEVNSVIDQVLNSFQGLVTQKKIHVSTSIDPSAGTIQTDEHLLKEVLMNVVSNAIAYSPAGASINVGATSQDGHVLFHVRDTGYGIPTSQQSRVFEKFFRGDNIVKKVPNGTGLGLYIAKGIIHSLGGKIWFDSEENKGTTFWFEIPFAATQQEK